MAMHTKYKTANEQVNQAHVFDALAMFNGVWSEVGISSLTIDS